MNDATPMTTSDREVIVEREFDAPPEAVFAAWTDPDQVAAWFGPAGMDTPRDRVRMDARAGGRLELTMVRRDGDGEFAIGYDIVELVEPELIVLRSDPMPGAGMHEPTVVRIALEDLGGRTRLTLTDGPFPAGAAAGAGAGWRAALEKLAALLV